MEVLSQLYADLCNLGCRGYHSLCGRRGWNSLTVLFFSMYWEIETQKFRIAFQTVKKMFVGLVIVFFAILFPLQLNYFFTFLQTSSCTILSLLFLISHPSFACLGLIPVLPSHFEMHIWILYFFQLISTSFLYHLLPVHCSKNQLLVLTSSFLFSFMWQFQPTPAAWLYLLSCLVISPILPICLLMSVFPNLGFQKLLVSPLFTYLIPNPSFYLVCSKLLTWSTYSFCPQSSVTSFFFYWV